MINKIGNNVLIAKLEKEEYSKTNSIWIGVNEEVGFYIDIKEIDEAIEVLNKAKELFQ